MQYEADLLAQIDRQPNKTIYIKLISLNYDEQPIQSIEGRATSGSINIDGTSAVRRTCQISMVTDTLDISDYYWTLKTKFKVQIGVKNTVTGNPDIVWFDQGVYVIYSFSSAYSSNGYTVNISGKDKMCMLNGELGGTINSSASLDSYDEIDKNNNKRTIKNPLKQVIRELVYHYGKEPMHNIIINDLDMTGLELLEYRYDIPLYLIRKEGSSVYETATLSDEVEGVDISRLAQYDETTIDGTVINSTIVAVNGVDYNVAKIDFGETAGYKEIDLVYPTELLANAGETVMSELDKIKNMLGNYEYFYDLDGRFIFQQKKTYVNSSWGPSVQNEGDQVYIESYMAATPYSYKFSDSSLFTAFNNTPNLANLKNDFTVWGKNKNDLAIHMRYAIDVKPNYYRSITVSKEEVEAHNNKYNLSVQEQNSITYWYDDGTSVPDEKFIECDDWREIIYQMQKDYYKYNFLDDFALKVGAANPNHYPTGATGYEQYYVDIQGFWRYLYTPENIYEKIELTADTYQKSIYYIIENDKYVITDKDFDENIDYYILSENYYPQSHDLHPGWNKTVYESPSNLLFWFDFLDTRYSDLAQYAVPVVGIRSKVENDSNVKAIYYGDTPQIIFDNYSDGLQPSRSGYKYFNLPSSSYGSMFSRSTQGKSAKDAIDTLLYNYTCCTESVSIQSVPIYYLQPNTLIYINDIKANIEGEYIINKITIPLAYNGTMSIQGTKVINRLY